MDKVVFDVALSFAGEDRELVSEVAKILVQKNILVFYDEFYRSELLGKELVSYLRDLYGKRAKYCVVFVSKSYKSKKWPHKVEFPAIIEKSLDSKDDYLIPVRIDESDLKGLLGTVGYLEAKDFSANEIANLIAKKIGMPNEPTIEEQELFKKLSYDKVFIGEFVSMFIDRIKNTWIRYSLGVEATKRFSKRHQYGSLLESYGLAHMDSNFEIDDLDIFISIDLSQKGVRMRNYMSDMLSK